jgi:hypothetical protein
MVGTLRHDTVIGFYLVAFAVNPLHLSPFDAGKLVAVIVNFFANLTPAAASSARAKFMTRVEHAQTAYQQKLLILLDNFAFAFFSWQVHRFACLGFVIDLPQYMHFVISFLPQLAQFASICSRGSSPSSAVERIGRSARSLLANFLSLHSDKPKAARFMRFAIVA